MKMFKICLILTVFFGLVISLSAQQTENSPKKDFEEYGTERTLGQTPSNSGSKNPPINRRRKKQPIKQKKKQYVRVGRGIKISLEKQEKCQGDFNLVPSTTIFEGGDCIRAKFKLNFAGYLTIINLGTSKNEVIYSANNLSKKLKAQTEHVIPDEKGWEFYGNPGFEQFIFIVSQKPISQTTIRKYLSERNSATENSEEFEAITRDLKPRQENDSVYILVNPNRNEDPFIFRMTLKHQ